MKLLATVHEVKSSGERLCVRLKARGLASESRGLASESIFSTVLHEIEMPDSATARRAYFVGREVALNIRPTQ